jgi:recombination protein RecR
MQKLPLPLERLITHFEKLPGIGPKSAQRLAFYLLHVPFHEVKAFADSLMAVKEKIVLCEKCHHVSEQNICSICADGERDQSLLCVVEQPLDVLAFERAGIFKGLFHVLHGAISPLNNIGPDQLFLFDITERLEGVDEIIMATNPTMEGEATAMYMKDLLAKKGFEGAITRIGHGLPVGADIEYADSLTLSRALQGRTKA